MNEHLRSRLRLLMPRVVHNHRIWAGPLRGKRIVTSWHDYPAAILGRTGRPLLEWFVKNVNPGETWLDVGAHYGYTAIALSRLVGKQGRVFAFEPMLSTAGYVTQTRHLNRFPQLTRRCHLLQSDSGLDRIIHSASSQGKIVILCN
jgi:hypothetical protein